MSSPPPPLTPAEFQAALSVSRETLARLEAYAALLGKWQKAINLVGPASLDDPWRRHFLDSAQLLALAPEEARTWLDIGSGAGFPGLVLAILGVPEMHLVESDSRKCAFLREAARITNTKITIHNTRIESLPILPADVIIARALAPMTRLLEWSERFFQNNTRCLFLKGRDAENELTLARKSWNIQLERLPSRSDPSGIIVSVKGFRRA